MATQVELLKTMTFILDTLVDNAKKINEAIKLMLSPKDLEAFQEKQTELLNELARLDELVKSSAAAAKDGEEVEFLRSEVRHKIVHFQGLNRDFIQSASAKSRIIQKGEFATPPTKVDDNE